MKTFTRNLIAILVIGAAVLAARSTTAGGFSFGGGGGNGGGNGGGHGHGGFKFSFNGNHHHNNHHHHKHHVHHGHYHHNYRHHVRYYTPPVRHIYSQCYHPHFRSCYVIPGDTWYTISKRIYGVDFLCNHIASYNGLSMHSPLVPGQLLQVPVVNANGSLAASSAPAPAPFAPQGVPFGAQGAQLGPQGVPGGLAPQGPPAGLAPQSVPSGLNAGSIAPQGPSIAPMQNAAPAASAQPSAPASPAANIRTIAEEPAIPRVAIGSTLMLDGESLGSDKGIVRLRIGGMALPVEVIEWTADAVKIQLPKMDLNRPVKAEMEVLRADGSLASNSAIELTPAATRLALGK